MRQLRIWLLIANYLLLITAVRAQTNTNPITREVVEDAEKLIGLDFSEAKIQMLLPGLKNQLEDFQAIHKFPLSNSVPPAILFNPLPVGFQFDHSRSKFKLNPAR